VISRTELFRIKGDLVPQISVSHSRAALNKLAKQFCLHWLDWTRTRTLYSFNYIHMYYMYICTYICTHKWKYN